jgi:hypothetical protein
MTENFVDILTEAGPLGIFALYLIWQRQKDTQRMEALQEKFLTKLDAMDQRSDAAVSELRDRYDKVISDYNKERSDMISGFGKLDQLIMRMGMTPAQTPVTAPPTVPEPPGPGMTMQIEQKVQEALDKIAHKDEDDS